MNMGAVENDRGRGLVGVLGWAWQPVDPHPLLLRDQSIQEAYGLGVDLP